MFRVTFRRRAVVEPGRPRVGVTGEVLHVFERDVLLQQVGDRRDAERVGRKLARQASPS